MTGPSFLGVATALAFVLGLLALGAWAVRRFAPGRVRGGSGVGRIEVLARAPLAARQGVATVRVEGHTALISYGDGGVHFLMELPPTPQERVRAERGGRDSDDDGLSPGPQTRELPRLSPFARTLARMIRRIPTARTLTSLGLLALLLALPTVAGAQTAPSVTQPQVHAPAGARTPTVPSGTASRSRRPAAAPVQTTSSSPGGPAIPEVSVSLGSGKDGGMHLSGPVGTVLFIGFLTLLPTLLLLMTSFTRILVVLHLLKQALGTQTAPPAHLLTAMAIILTGFVMAPTLEQVNQRALKPWMDGKLDGAAVMKEAQGPFRDFMLRQTREADLAQFVAMSNQPAPDSPDHIPMATLTAAFVTSELTKAFQMGFALFLPFVIIDLVVASVLMSMGMFMLPPVMVSLPFKLLLFVLVNGWSLVIGSLVRSF